MPSLTFSRNWKGLKQTKCMHFCSNRSKWHENWRSNPIWTSWTRFFYHNSQLFEVFAFNRSKVDWLFSSLSLNWAFRVLDRQKWAPGSHFWAGHDRLLLHLFIPNQKNLGPIKSRIEGKCQSEKWVRSIWPELRQRTWQLWLHALFPHSCFSLRLDRNPTLLMEFWWVLIKSEWERETELALHIQP